MKINILILGTDMNAYTMARCYHELYNKKVDMIGRGEVKATSLSKICNITYIEDFMEEKKFKKVLSDYGKKHKKTLLIGTNDALVKLMAEHSTYLKQWYEFNIPSLSIVSDFLDKTNFYNTYSHVFDIPKTYIYSCLDKKLEIDFMFPVILKPGNGVDYFKNKFEGQSKVYKIETIEKLKEVISVIEESGYEDTLIIQEFIPGDDSKLHDCMVYVDADGKMQFATFAQIGLQEHTKTGVGNCTVLVSGYSEYGIPKELIYKIKDFMESIHFTGFAEFDFKYDERDKKFKLFEINPRQARCSYYLNASGCNPIKYLVDDLYFTKKKKFKIVKKKTVLSFVPNIVIKSSVENENLKSEIKKLIKEKQFYDPLDYKKDNSLKRKIYLFLRDINFIKKYRNKDWWD